MTKRNLCAAALTAAGLLAAAPVAQADHTDALLARIGKFRLDNGDSKKLNRGVAKAYRICMEEGPGAVPLKVTHEGQETLVPPGECRVIEGTKIRLAGASRLPNDMTLIGTFTTRGAKSYKTDVSLARAVSDE